MVLSQLERHHIGYERFVDVHLVPPMCSTSAHDLKIGCDREVLCTRVGPLNSACTRTNTVLVETSEFPATNLPMAIWDRDAPPTCAAQAPGLAGTSRGSDRKRSLSIGQAIENRTLPRSVSRSQPRLGASVTPKFLFWAPGHLFPWRL